MGRTEQLGRKGGRKKSAAGRELCAHQPPHPKHVFSTPSSAAKVSKMADATYSPVQSGGRRVPRPATRAVRGTALCLQSAVSDPGAGHDASLPAGRGRDCAAPGGSEPARCCADEVVTVLLFTFLLLPGRHMWTELLATPQ